MAETITRCTDCGNATDGQCVHCAQRVCLDCSESGHDCPGLNGGRWRRER
jgi:hypothetical protein